MTRRTRPTVPRCWKTLQRKRPEAGDAVGEVDLLAVLELLALGRGHDRRRHRDGVLVVEAALLGGRDEVAPHPHHRVAADLQVEVRRAALDGDLQEFVDVHEHQATGCGLQASGQPGPGDACRPRPAAGCAGYRAAAAVAGWPLAAPGADPLSQPWVSGTSPLMMSKNRLLDGGGDRAPLASPHHDLVDRPDRRDLHGRARRRTPRRRCRAPRAAAFPRAPRSRGLRERDDRVAGDARQDRRASTAGCRSRLRGR